MDDDAIERLKRRLASKAALPTTAFGRARRTAGAAFRVGAGALSNRLRGEALDSAVFEQLVVSLGALKGIAMKAGQILSYLDTELPDEAKRLLAVLQVTSQPTDFAVIEATLREDFGPRADTLLAGLEREAVATASIGQVHRARLADGTQVAVKVRHAGIEAAIAADFRTAAAGTWLPKTLLPGVHLGDLVNEARETFLAECDYEAERRNTERFGQLYAGHPSITIPEVCGEWCSRRVLTTRWCDGVAFEPFVLQASQRARDRAGRALYEFYIGAVYRHGLFNGDPHPGNLLFGDDGALTVLDYGCVRVFERPLVAALAALSRAVQADDDVAIRKALVGLGAAEPDGATMAVTRQLLRGFFGPVLVRGPHRVETGLNLDARTIMKDKLAIARMQLPAKLLFLFRIRFGLHSELKRLGSVVDWAALEAELSATAARGQ